MGCYEKHTHDSIFAYSWIERQLHMNQQKNNFPANQRDYDNSETTVEKLSARRVQIFWIYFSVIIFWPLIF